MAIPRKIRRRTAEAVLLFMMNDPDFFALGGGQGVVGNPEYRPPRMFLGPYAEVQKSIAMEANPRQYHVYNGDSVKESDSGEAWNREFVVRIECYSPIRDEVLSEIGGPADVDDELDELGDRIYRGQSPNGGVGRFRDPDNPDGFITLGIERIEIGRPSKAPDDSAIRRVMAITFFTREDAEGNRV